MSFRVLVYAIDYPVRMRNPSGPVAREIVFESFGFADTSEAVTKDVADDLVGPPHEEAIGLELQVVLPPGGGGPVVWVEFSGSPLCRSGVLDWGGGV